MISMDKQYRTKSGYAVRIYAVDGRGDYPVHGAILNCNMWVVGTWAANGKRVMEKTGHNDLIEVKPRIQREYWVNVFKFKHMVSIHFDKKFADQNRDRIACVKITIDCEEGEGL